MSATERKPMQGRVRLDGKTFTDIAFQKAELVYEGGLAPNFVNCTFEGTRFVFDGAAGNTVNLLRAMLHPQSNMRPVVLGLMPEIGLN
jgi:hypothetical protein